MESEDMKTAGGRRELRKQARREAIIRAARESFLERGYAGTSMSGLLDTLGGSKATLWGYFRSKEELFAAVIEDASAAFRAELADVLSPDENLEQGLLGFCRSFLSTLQAPVGVAAWRLIAAESGRFPEVGRIFYERVAKPVEMTLADYLSRYVAREELRGEDPLEMAITLTSLCAGRQQRLIWGVETSDPARVEADAIRFTDLFLRAFGAG
jgi:AcrR family transcriptional regulator